MNNDWLKKFKTIVIEGPIGVGKTSLTLKIAERFNFKTVLEAAEENPFLDKFYKNNTKYAFPTQLFFPISDFSFDGIHWSNPEVWFPNLAGIIILFIYRKKYTP